MINLIPPSAKKSIVIEYWLRVFSVWGFIWAISLAIGIALLLPVYVLINLQVSNLTDSAASASQKLASYQDVTKDLNIANQQARSIVDTRRFKTLSTYNEQFKALETGQVQLTSINITRGKDGVAPISLAGNAQNREALANFRDQIKAIPEVAAVDLPISNLAKDRDIQFTMSVTIKP